jgi:hypothetical protein
MVHAQNFLAITSLERSKSPPFVDHERAVGARAPQILSADCAAMRSNPPNAATPDIPLLSRFPFISFSSILSARRN